MWESQKKPSIPKHTTRTIANHNQKWCVTNACDPRHYLLVRHEQLCNTAVTPHQILLPNHGFVNDGLINYITSFTIKRDAQVQ